MKPPHYWRTGHTVGRTIYDGDDNLIGVMDTPQLADRVVASVNWGLDNEQVLRSHQPGDNIEIDPQAIAEYTEGLNALALVRRVERLSGQLAETQIIRDAYLDYGEQNDVNFGKEALRWAHDKRNQRNT